MDERELELLYQRRKTALKPWTPVAQNKSPEFDADKPIRHTASISVIIPTYHNGLLKQHSLRRALEGIARSKTIKEIIIAVGDDRGGEYKSQFAGFSSKPIRFIQSKPNERALSRNVAAAKATGQFLLFLDDDMLIKDWRIADVILSHVLAGKFDAAMFPRRTYVRFPVLFDAPALDEFIQRWRKGKVGDDPCYHDPYLEGSKYRSLVFCFPGCFMIVRKSAFKRLGGFPEQYSGWGFEDAHFAMEAVSKLKVLNLFLKAEPLLHIDHPVTPYKAEELERNHSQFLSATNYTDLEIFCARVFAAEDFSPRTAMVRRNSTLLTLPKLLNREHRIPLDVDEVREMCHRITERRSAHGAESNPKQVVLHGSRANGASRRDSDYDLLVLFGGSSTKEFFVSWNGGPPVEFEFSSYEVFEQMARQPDGYGLQGLLELKKIVRSRWLWGNELEWNSWRRHVIDVACLNGRTYWLAFLIGLHLNAKDQHRFEHVRDALSTLLGDFTLPDDLRYVQQFKRSKAARRLRTLLDARSPKWREDSATGRKVFASQPPEVWRALKWLAHRS
jgi:glycosyltransferase involved in cell wall biosynthesis